ncbi:MAG: hypothetical protein ACTSV2_17645 [Candidatus Thorarchaeota archaeon]
MRKQVLSIIAVVLAVAICTSSVVAVTNQNLSWGISVGQRLDYDYYRESLFFNDTRFEDFSIIRDFQFYHIIESLPAISDDIESGGDLPDTPNRTCYYANGTEPTFPFRLYVIPIGNWDLIIDLWIESGVNESEIVDTPQFVGYNATWSWDDGNTTYIYAEIYSRSTGVLHTLQQYSPVSENFITSLEIVLIPSDDIPVIYILAAGGIVSVVIVAIVLMKRK